MLTLEKEDGFVYLGVLCIRRVHWAFRKCFFWDFLGFRGKFYGSCNVCVPETWIVGRGFGVNELFIGVL